MTAEELARRHVWWRAPEEVLADPPVLLRQVLGLGTADDYVAARSLFGEDALREALVTAPPGAIDDRSMAFWRRQFGPPDEAPPRRRFH